MTPWQTLTSKYKHYRQHKSCRGSGGVAPLTLYHLGIRWMPSGQLHDPATLPLKEKTPQHPHCWSGCFTGKNYVAPTRNWTLDNPACSPIPILCAPSWLHLQYANGILITDDSAITALVHWCAIKFQYHAHFSRTYYNCLTQYITSGCRERGRKRDSVPTCALTVAKIIHHRL